MTDGRTVGRRKRQLYAFPSGSINDNSLCVGETRMKSFLTVGEMGVDEMGIGETGVGETGVGEMGTSHYRRY